MLRLLVPIDGSEVSDRAAGRVLRMLEWYREKPEVHLINVQSALPQNASRFISQEQLEGFHREEGEKALASARKRLDEAGVAFTHHICVGEPGPMIAALARDQKIDLIVMGTQGHGNLAGAVLGSVARKVVHLADVPVVLVK